MAERTFDVDDDELRPPVRMAPRGREKKKHHKSRSADYRKHQDGQTSADKPADGGKQHRRVKSGKQHRRRRPSSGSGSGKQQADEARSSSSSGMALSAPPSAHSDAPTIRLSTSAAAVSSSPLSTSGDYAGVAPYLRVIVLGSLTSEVGATVSMPVQVCVAEQFVNAKRLEDLLPSPATLPLQAHISAANSARSAAAAQVHHAVGYVYTVRYALPALGFYSLSFDIDQQPLLQSADSLVAIDARHTVGSSVSAPAVRTSLDASSSSSSSSALVQSTSPLLRPASLLRSPPSSPTFSPRSTSPHLLRSTSPPPRAVSPSLLPVLDERRFDTGLLLFTVDTPHQSRWLSLPAGQQLPVDIYVRDPSGQPRLVSGKLRAVAYQYTGSYDDWQQPSNSDHAIELPVVADREQPGRYTIDWTPPLGKFVFSVLYNSQLIGSKKHYIIKVKSKASRKK